MNTSPAVKTQTKLFWQIIPVSDPSLLENLDMRQRQSLIARELARWRTEASRRAHITMSKSSLE